MIDVRTATERELARFEARELLRCKRDRSFRSRRLAERRLLAIRAEWARRDYMQYPFTHLGGASK